MDRTPDSDSGNAGSIPAERIVEKEASATIRGRSFSTKKQGGLRWTFLE